MRLTWRCDDGTCDWAWRRGECGGIPGIGIGIGIGIGSAIGAVGCVANRCTKIGVDWRRCFGAAGLLKGRVGARVNI